MRKEYVLKNDTRANALGKWRGILRGMGLTDANLSGKHGPCPLCEGTDRFRYTDYKGGGEYYCSVCGPGSGFDLIMGVNDIDFANAAQQVDKILGGDGIEQVFQPRVDIEKRRRDMNSLWRHANDRTIVSQWLQSRGIKNWAFNYPDLRGHPSMFMADSGHRHRAMLALIRNSEGMPISIHRTYIDAKQRKIMPPMETIVGSAIRLGRASPDLPLVVGEGIETVLSGMEEFGCPGYACISANGMEAVILPAGIDIIILADNDNSFAGQKSAFTLARKLDSNNKNVRVVMRSVVGFDFNDEVKPGVDTLEWKNDGG